MKPRRTGTVAVLVALLAASLGWLGLAQSPAHADGKASLDVTLGESVTVGAFPAPAKGIAFPVTGAHAVHPKITFDTVFLDSAVASTFPAGCTAAGTVHTCPLPGGDVTNTTVTVELRALEHPTPGIVPPQIAYSVGADNVAERQLSVLVVLGQGSDLAVAPPESSGGKANPGDHVRIAVRVRNDGNEPAHGFRLAVGVDKGLAFTTPGTCTSRDKTVAIVVDCAFPDVVLASGQVATAFDVGATVTRDAIGRQEAFYRVVPLGADLDDANDGGSVGWTVANTVDVAAVGATGTGAVGDVVKLPVGLHVNGPAFLSTSHQDDPLRSYEVALPPGTEPVLVPGNCTAVTSGYRCTTDQAFLRPGDESTVIFRVRITRVIADAAGSVRVLDQPTDADPGNDTAQIVLNPSGLPITGASAAAVAGLGALLLVVGGVLFVTSRRRRSAGPR
jgi:hypothetical protein